jgi:hypothetical protein
MEGCAIPTFRASSPCVSPASARAFTSIEIRSSYSRLWVDLTSRRGTCQIWLQCVTDFTIMGCATWDDAMNANCQICGFQLTALEEECPRCASFARHLAIRRSAALEDVQIVRAIAPDRFHTLEPIAEPEPEPLLIPRGAVPAPPRGFKCSECGLRFGPGCYMFFRESASGASYGLGSSGRITPRYYFRRRRLCEDCARYHDQYLRSGCAGAVLTIACSLLAVLAAVGFCAGGAGP